MLIIKNPNIKCPRHSIGDILYLDFKYCLETETGRKNDLIVDER